MSDSLAGQLLIAMPGLKDPRFEKSVILICESSKSGIMGLIINKEIHNLKLNIMLFLKWTMDPQQKDMETIS